MKITLTEFVTLDGVSQGPGSPAEDTSDDFGRRSSTRPIRLPNG